jgi:hypothetical protein
MDRLIIPAIIIFLIFFSLTYLLHRFFKARRFIKYLPSLVSLIAAIINIALARSTQGEGFKDLAYVLMSMLFFIGFISGILSGLYFDYIARK